MKRLLSILLLGFAACGGEAEPTPADELEWGQDYVRSAAVGRRALLESLVEDDNGYASLRVQNYGPGRPWNELEVANPPVRPLVVGDLGQFDSPWKVSEGEFARLPELSEWSHEALMDLGRAAFERYPLGADQKFMHGVRTPENAQRFGLWNYDGRVGGLVRVRVSEDVEAFAPTCSTCHASELDGQLVVGRPNEDFDYDAMALHGASGPGTFPPSRWGAGAVDVTPDASSNPAAMADLRALRYQRRLHWAGTLHNSLQALTVRIETLIITSLNDARPPREVAFALAYYLWNLGLEGEPASGRGEGAKLFAENCATCHGYDGWAGEPVPVDMVGTDELVAHSSTRGLADPVYRVPSLWGVGTRGQFLHHGRVRSLEDLLDPERDEPGHRFGTHLSDGERAELAAYVRTIGR